MGSSMMANRYWIPNYDIEKRVIIREIQYYLGPESSVRSYTREGEDGFLITTPGECLTDEQIDDICLKSKAYWEKRATRLAYKKGTRCDIYLESNAVLRMAFKRRYMYIWQCCACGRSGINIIQSVCPKICVMESGDTPDHCPECGGTGECSCGYIS